MEVHRRLGWLILASFVLTVTMPASIDAQARRAGAATARTQVSNVNRNANVNVNRNANVNVNRSANVNVNRNVNVHHDVYVHGRYDAWGHPIAAAAAVTAAAVAVGTVVASLPPSCSVLVVNGVTYQNCAGVYYQPVYRGTSVQYVVVTKP